MKNLLPLVLLAAIIIPAAVSAQETSNAQSRFSSNTFLNSSYKDTVNSKAFYLKKSKTQRTVGWCMLGGGVAMVVAGGGIFANNFELFSRQHDNEAGAGAVMFLCGAGCTLGSIPFFISAAHNTKNAARVSMGNQQLSVPGQNNYAGKMQPAITITVKL